MIKVFVYGTLKKGEGNHRLLAGRSVFCGEDCIRGKLFDLGPFPAAMKEGTDLIHGEIYMVGPTTLGALDRLEGHPSFYKREVVKTLNQKQDVWVYFLPKMEHKALHLPNGVWSARS